MARTLRQLMKATPQPDRLRAEHVKIVATKTRRSENGMPLVLAKVRSIENAKGQRIPSAQASVYVCGFEVYEKGHVIASCSCSQFMYRLEYFLNKVGAARIHFSNGEAPTHNAADGGPWLCKHLYAFATRLVEEGKL